MTSSPRPPYEFKDSLPVRETSGGADVEAQASDLKGEDAVLEGNEKCTRTDGNGKQLDPLSVVKQSLRMTTSCIQANRLPKRVAARPSESDILKLTSEASLSGNNNCTDCKDCYE